MNRFRNFIAFLIAIIAFSAASVPAQRYVNTGNVSNKSMEQQITHQLRMLPHYGVFDHITYQVNGGTVILSGKVYSLGTKRDAASAVKGIPGVVSVVNRIDELPPSSFDNQIRRQALHSFVNNGLGRYFWEINPDVRIIVERGHITLEGYVASKGDYDRMNIYANGIPGVFGVKNNLIVGKPVKG